MLHNYWLGIMAGAFAIALAVWIFLVFNADRHPQGRAQNSLPHREVMGGEFEARDGGRQLMPHPGQPREPAGVEPDSGLARVPGQPRPVVTERPGMPLPEQSGAPAPEQAPARTGTSLTERP
jgi:hypothetical protein